jgi:hypothetical protein
VRNEILMCAFYNLIKISLSDFDADVIPWDYLLHKSDKPKCSPIFNERKRFKFFSRFLSLEFLLDLRHLICARIFIINFLTLLKYLFCIFFNRNSNYKEISSRGSETNSSNSNWYSILASESAHQRMR